MEKRQIKIFFTLFLVLFIVGTQNVFSAFLSLSPPQGNYQIGDVFKVQIMLNTEGEETRGVGIRYLNYDNSLLKVIDQSSDPGVQIKPGNLLSRTQVNSVNEEEGIIEFVQLSSGVGFFKGAGVLAEIEFKPLKAGQAKVLFDFSPGSTTDTNVASAGEDILDEVKNGIYNLSSAGGEVKCSEANGVCFSRSCSQYENCYSLNLDCATGYCCVGVCQKLKTETNGNGAAEAEKQAKIALLKTRIVSIIAQINLLQAELDKLLAQEAEEVKQYVIPAGFRFANTLEYGASGTDVYYLQIFLRNQGTSIYPEGKVTSWFGPETRAAVIRFQNKYAADILTPWGFVNGTGIVGRTTRNKINELLSLP